ncbi:hypothetical protein COW36_12550 [bacterium (Candidatus Blackallbacteria) CG17_big_fil_post_rev_8_21_14_2_50_48_46]|uniref:Outer membrane protein beta-barrel domain-containing protein n=1 Tax=bacterium (Candidatus Blackallbacteria) CG17_big_fil_post_rev_8_21_14_2_50_48_46 TaxID=2014261 RepID=A0A2M7G4B2_9BACT|nr:MAG: hypothetical protein COW64_02710 [bacterium (Candidatus Blackallbacteria) CG18_big_fil_WC_8_21_14_2_50_49_26]PIW16591.1 MAG: hypothetical protein COW36_12550 [bacterium (Candidatus Blackallbacteria) CG17_big_fil_post_rev_8_21_14_2_50_48_46]PIW46099.1 MAG: hypothetical protein COW20_17815 [bacterium (Candidatus Blackallbacteria) CG13_big_fil_rev_8_21_14_2_50_49_14]
MNRVLILFSFVLVSLGQMGSFTLSPAAQAAKPKPSATPKPTSPPVIPRMSPIPTPVPSLAPPLASPAPRTVENPVLESELGFSLQVLEALPWGSGWTPGSGLMLGAEYDWQPQFGIFAGAGGFFQNNGLSLFFPLSLRYRIPLQTGMNLFSGLGGFVVYAPGVGFVPGALVELGSEYRLNAHWQLSLTLDTGISFGSGMAFTTGLRGGLNFRP